MFQNVKIILLFLHERLKIQFQDNVFLVLFIFTLLRIIVRLVIAKKMYQYIFSRLKQRNQNETKTDKINKKIITSTQTEL